MNIKACHHINDCHPEHSAAEPRDPQLPLLASQQNDRAPSNAAGEYSATGI